MFFSFVSKIIHPIQGCKATTEYGFTKQVINIEKNIKNSILSFRSVKTEPIKKTIVIKVVQKIIKAGQGLKKLDKGFLSRYYQPD